MTFWLYEDFKAYFRGEVRRRGRGDGKKLKRKGRSVYMKKYLVRAEKLLEAGDTNAAQEVIQLGRAKT